jgi:hypothetical protein
MLEVGGILSMLYFLPRNLGPEEDHGPGYWRAPSHDIGPV